MDKTVEAAVLGLYQHVAFEKEKEEEEAEEAVLKNNNNNKRRRNVGRVVVYGDSNCIDSSHETLPCYWLLLDMYVLESFLISCHVYFYSTLSNLIYINNLVQIFFFFYVDHRIQYASNGVMTPRLEGMTTEISATDMLVVNQEEENESERSNDRERRPLPKRRKEIKYMTFASKVLGGTVGATCVDVASP
jgi:hypothetical protein